MLGLVIGRLSCGTSRNSCAARPSGSGNGWRIPSGRRRPSGRVFLRWEVTRGTGGGGGPGGAAELSLRRRAGRWTSRAAHHEFPRRNMQVPGGGARRVGQGGTRCVFAASTGNWERLAEIFQE